MAAFDLSGAAREREGFIVVVQTGTLARPDTILAAVKRSKWINGRMVFPESKLTPKRGCKFVAISRHDVFRLPRSRHIEEAKPHFLFAQGGQEYRHACLSRFFAVLPPF